MSEKFKRMSKQPTGDIHWHIKNSTTMLRDAKKKRKTRIADANLVYKEQQAYHQELIAEAKRVLAKRRKANKRKK